jgi:hypothetical protein
MNKTVFHKVGTVALVAIMAAPFAANAESTLATGTGPLSTTARVDFQITIPKFVSLRVGSAGAVAPNLVTFAPTAAQMDAGGVVTGGGGDLGGGVVTAIVRGNGGNVTLGASTLGALQNGSNTIAWTEITTATSVPALTPPVLANGPSTSTTVTAAANGVVNQSAAWTYSYANSAVVPAGTYGGVNVNNGRVTYTASVL